MNTSTQPKTYDNTPAHSVAFLGLGVMGYPMAAHLALAGHRVTVYNRTASKSEAFCAELAPTGRVKSAETPAAAAQGADLVFCCVGNDDDLRSVVLGEQGALAGMKPGAIFVDHTTASANVARELYAAARARGLSFVDAPVSDANIIRRGNRLSLSHFPLSPTPLSQSLSVSHTLICSI